jgi:hypothetical protein
VSARSSASRDLRRRVEGWRAAERLENALRREEGIPEPEASIEAAIELCELDPLSPGAEDPVRSREVQETRAVWEKLRRRFGWQPSAKSGR